MSERFTTGIDDLDPLLGGGFVEGGNVSIQHNAPEVIDVMAIRLSVHVFDSLLSVTALQRPEMTEADLDEVLGEMDISLDALLENDQLFMLDAHEEWSDRQNVFMVADSDDVRHGVETGLDRARSRGMAHIVDVGTLIDLVGSEAGWELHGWYEEIMRGQRDLLLDFLHRPSLPDAEVERYTEQADQVLVVEDDDDGTRLTVAKTPDGASGATRRVELLDEDPYLQLIE